MLQGVTDKIRENLRQTVGICIQEDSHRGLFPYQLQRVWATEPEYVLDTTAKFVEVCLGFLHHNLAGLHTGEVENLVDQIQQTIIVAFNNLVEFHAVFL